MNAIYYRNLHHKAHSEPRHQGTISIVVENGRAYVRMPGMTADRLHDFVVIENFPLEITVGLGVAVTGDETGFITLTRPHEAA